MDWLFSPEALIALGTLTLLEVVLGIDNLVFLTILAGKLPDAQQARARRIGLLLALGMRVVLLLLISWIIGLTAPLFTVVGQEISGRDLILLIGGLFLLAKSTTEIHHKLEGESSGGPKAKAATFGAVIVQIGLMDLIFSLDSVITAVGMADEIGVMIIAVVIAMGVMLAFARSLGDFGVTLMIAGDIPGETQTASLAIYDAIQANREADAEGMIVVLTALAMLVLYAVNKLRRRGGV